MRSGPCVLACLAAVAAVAALGWLRSPRPAPFSRAGSLPPVVPGGHSSLALTPAPVLPAAEPVVVLTLPAPVPLPSTADEEELLRQIEAARKEADPARREELLVAVCLRWADFDPPAALALSIELKLDPLGGALLPNLAQQWAARDFSAAHAWAGGLPEGELRDQVYSRLAYERARDDPPGAARLLAGMRSSGPARDEATITIVHAWALRDPAGARAWVETIPVGPLRERARVELAASEG